jgi:hypothetical protein
LSRIKRYFFGFISTNSVLRLTSAPPSGGSDLIYETIFRKLLKEELRTQEHSQIIEMQVAKIPDHLYPSPGEMV